MIRKAEPKDRGDIQRLHQSVFDYEFEYADPYQDTDFPNYDIAQFFYDNIVNEMNGHFGYVFDEERIIKGYVSLRVQNPTEYNHRKNLSILQLQTIGVDESYRGQGIGRQLVNHAKQVAKDLGFSHMRVVALAKNDRARHLYKECGFHEQEIIHEVEV
jgi:ribosomal protein S18 acetylase RimI-like enzyme